MRGEGHFGACHTGDGFNADLKRTARMRDRNLELENNKCSFIKASQAVNESGKKKALSL